MPELPEMERYKIVLGTNLIGKTITDIEVNREKSLNVPVPQFTVALKGKKIIDIKRRAKHLIFYLNTGENLLLHLMLGGWMFLGTEEESPNRTKQVILSFGERNLYFIGLRLGYLHLLSREVLDEKLAGLGPEPLGLTFEQFLDRIRRKTGTLKSILVDQSVFAGIGNCYSDEICFNARLHTAKKAADLSDRDLEDLFNAISPTLKRALEIGGYIDDPIYIGDTKTGQYNNNCLVYDCEGQPCKRCGTAIEKISVSSKKSFICPNCQKLS